MTSLHQPTLVQIWSADRVSNRGGLTRGIGLL